MNQGDAQPQASCRNCGRGASNPAANHDEVVTAARHRFFRPTQQLPAHRVKFRPIVWRNNSRRNQWLNEDGRNITALKRRCNELEAEVVALKGPDTGNSVDTRVAGSPIV